MEIFSRLGWFFKQEKKQYIIGVSLLFLVSILATLVPMVIAAIIDGMTAKTLTANQLWIWI
ncbi:MAG TPA: multidrug ABC transporter permease/ATP-binding protein, partial [Globicatella sulfidifaciens]|nr:multidrug ABC transporter permease/ATP-binding protein [Globicatella sulfidifaciens]